MDWSTASFASYNPYSDQRIDPINGDLEKHPDLPFYIHNAVARAKLLVANVSMEEILLDASQIAKIISASYFYNEVRTKTADGRIMYSGSAGALRDYLEANADESKEFQYGGKGFSLRGVDRDIPFESWPRMFGVLALSLAGDIINELWPTSEYTSIPPRFINDDSGSRASSFSEKEKGRLLYDYAADALQAVGFGEGLLLANQYKKEKQNAAKKPSRIHQRLYEEFNSWALDVPSNHGYRTTEDAVNIGFKQYLREHIDGADLLKAIGDTTHRRLKKVLEEYCLESNSQYPFPRLRSKK